jgi:hypothetical protein
MYANIFSDVVIDNRRMKKRASNNLSQQELVDLSRMSQTWTDLSQKEQATILKHNLPFQGRPESKYSETRTTTIFTPGNNKMEQAMGVKMVADELLAATGTVLGASAGIFSSVAAKKPSNILKFAKSGEQIGRTVGGWMWSAING